MCGFSLFFPCSGGIGGILVNWKEARFKGFIFIGGDFSAYVFETGRYHVNNTKNRVVLCSGTIKGMEKGKAICEFVLNMEAMKWAKKI